MLNFLVEVTYHSQNLRLVDLHACADPVIWLIQNPLACKLLHNSNEDGNVGYLLGFLTLISITHSIVSRSEHTIKVSKAEMIFVTGVFVTAE